MPAAIVVARLSSSRLPGKVLLQVGGKPLIAYTLERLARCEAVGDLVLATSDDPSDDPLAVYCEEQEISCYRGSLNDVAGRVLGAAESAGCEWFFRANGDSPLLASDLYAPAWDCAVPMQSADDQPDDQPVTDIVTNVHPRTVPPGASVELIRSSALRREHNCFSDEEREHVTAYLYRHPSRFKINHLDCSGLTFSPSTRTAVDDQADLDRFTAMVAAMDRPHWDYTTQEVLDLAASVDAS